MHIFNVAQQSTGKPEIIYGTALSPVCEVRHLAALRLGRHRLGNQASVRDSYAAVAEELSALVP
ncbi:hypothetical protein [Streptomyces sp. NPDC007369]|uniref:hypothetical protein n=1 Tax=Streptomyces sp. NPDC007369 TaxID=3154589 RepID=UPI0033FA77AD